LERGFISERTKAALAAAKRRGQSPDEDDRTPSARPWTCDLPLRGPWRRAAQCPL